MNDIVLLKLIGPRGIIELVRDCDRYDRLFVRYGNEVQVVDSAEEALQVMLARIGGEPYVLH